MVMKYQKRISGPLLDRIDIHIKVPRVDYEKLSGDRVGESSEAIRTRVQAARDIQQTRFSKLDSKHPIFCNADMRVGEIRQLCKLQAEGVVLSRVEASESDAGGDESVESFCARLSSHPFDRLRASLKLARTIADPVGSEDIQSAHLAEALHLRSPAVDDGIIRKISAWRLASRRSEGRTHSQKIINQAVSLDLQCTDFGLNGAVER